MTLKNHAIEMVLDRIALGSEDAKALFTAREVADYVLDTDNQGKELIALYESEHGKSIGIPAQLNKWYMDGVSDDLDSILVDSDLDSFMLWTFNTDINDSYRDAMGIVVRATLKQVYDELKADKLNLTTLHHILTKTYDKEPVLGERYSIEEDN